MATSFNPYLSWLGIPLEDQPANYYSLLGLRLFENDPNIIEYAFFRQFSCVRAMGTGEFAEIAENLIHELCIARSCLLNSASKIPYDGWLREALVYSNQIPRSMEVSNEQVMPHYHVPTTHPQSTHNLSTVNQLPPQAANCPIPIPSHPLETNYPHEHIGSPVNNCIVEPVIRTALRKSKEQIAVEIAKVVGGGLGGVLIAIALLKWGFNSDPFGLFSKAPGPRIEHRIQSQRPIASEQATSISKSDQPNPNQVPNRSETSMAVNSVLGSEQKTISTSLSGTNESVTPVANPDFITRQFVFGAHGKLGALERVAAGKWLLRSNAKANEPRLAHFREFAKNREMLELISTADSEVRWQFTRDEAKLSTNSGRDWKVAYPGRWLPANKSLEYAAINGGAPEIIPLQTACQESFAIVGKGEFQQPEMKFVLDNTHLIVPTKLPRNYLIKATIARKSGSAGLRLGLQMQETPITLVLDDGNKHLSGIDGLGGKPLANSSTWTQEVFPADSTTAVAVLIEENVLRLAINGKETFRIETKPGDVIYPHLNDEAPYPELLWFSAQDAFEITDLKVVARTTAVERERASLLSSEVETPRQVLMDEQGLHQFDRNGNYQFRDGGLVLNRNIQRTILTLESYDNFEMLVQFKMAHGSDGAVLLGVPSQVDDQTVRRWDSLGNPRGPSFVHFSRGQAGETAGTYFNHPSPLALATLVPDGWNTLRIRAWGGRVETFLNGVKAVEAQGIGAADTFPGRIGIECKQGDILIRRVELRKLPPLANAPSMASMRRVIHTITPDEFVPSELSPSDAQTLAVAMERMKHALTLHAAQIKSAKQSMLKDFDSGIAMTLNDKTVPIALSDRIREEKMAFEKAGFIPFSERMRRASADYYFKNNKANQALADAFDQQLRHWKKEDEHVAMLLSAEKTRRLRPALVGRWSYPGGDIDLYLDGTCKRDGISGRWDLRGRWVQIEWREIGPNNFPLGTDACAIDVYGRTVEILLYGRQPVFATVHSS